MKTTIETTSEVITPEIALARFLGIEPSEVTQERYENYGLTVYSADGAEYAVGTDEEADSAWDASLDSYIEDCIEPELDKLEIGNLSAYVKFDREMWKRDARTDGRGHSLASYDGDEMELDGNFYAFRVN